MPGAVIVMVAATVLVLSVIEVAVTTTELLLPDGRAEGAVYVVEVPGPLVLNEPQAPLLPQVTDHFTPALTGSLVITTASDTVAPTCRAAGAAELKETAIGGVGVVLVVEDPPHATNATLMLTATSSKRDWRNVIVRLHAAHPWWLLFTASMIFKLVIFASRGV